MISIAKKSIGNSNGWTRYLSNYLCFIDDALRKDILGCGEIMEPCDVNEDCCDPLVCDNGRCFTAKGKMN